MENDEDVCLSAHAAAALAEFLAEQRQHAEQQEATEDWQLSQFWYDRETAERLTAECIAATDGNARIACLSCPTLFDEMVSDRQRVALEDRSVVLLEFDRRFEQKYGADHFTFYDYKQPLSLRDLPIESFDLIVADPPFLSDECLTNVAVSIRRLLRPNTGRILLCTGVVMTDMADRLLGLKTTNFIPRHKQNLANEFACYSNYVTRTV